MVNCNAISCKDNAHSKRAARMIAGTLCHEVAEPPYREHAVSDDVDRQLDPQLVVREQARGLFSNLGNDGACG